MSVNTSIKGGGGGEVNENGLLIFIEQTLPAFLDM